MLKQLTARERLLEVIRILQEHTDEKTMLTIQEIHSYFPEDVQVGEKAVRDDVRSLENSTIFPVVALQAKNGQVKHFYYDGRIFEIHELRLLMDAISAAKFIPRQDTNKLLGKIRKLTSESLGAELMNELYITEESTKGVAKIISSVQLLHEAIHDQRLVSFQYGRYGTNLQFTLSHDGDNYQVKPLGLVWNNDRYYLVAHFIEEDEVRQYRVDRMRNVRIEEGRFVKDPYFDLKTYTSKMFHMFGGDMISLEAEFQEKLLNIVIDRFGIDANLVAKQDGKFILKARVPMSDGFISWLLRWGAMSKSFIHPSLSKE